MSEGVLGTFYQHLHVGRDEHLEPVEEGEIFITYPHAGVKDFMGLAIWSSPNCFLKTCQMLNALKNTF